MPVGWLLPLELARHERAKPQLAGQMASSANEELEVLAEPVVVVAVESELAAAACRPSSEATVPMEHGTSSAGPSTCDDPPDSSLTSPFLNAASPILCAPLQDKSLPLARASHVWLPAEEQWRQLKPPTKRKQAVERPASGMAVGADAAGVPVSRRGPVADALPPGWVCDEHVSSSGIHYKRYRGPYGQRAQSVRDAWRKVEGEAEAREAGKEAGAGAGAAPHGGEPPAATAKATLSLAVRDDGTGRAVVAATVRASARARKQRSDKGKKRGPRAPAGALRHVSCRKTKLGASLRGTGRPFLSISFITRERDTRSRFFPVATGRFYLRWFRTAVRSGAELLA